MRRLSRREGFAGSPGELVKKVSRNSGGFRRVLEFLVEPHLGPKERCPNRDRLVRIGLGREEPTRDELDHFKMGCPLECGAYVARLTSAGRNSDAGSSA